MIASQSTSAAAAPSIVLVQMPVQPTPRMVSAGLRALRRRQEMSGDNWHLVSNAMREQIKYAAMVAEWKLESER